jgi:hypothetical protein
MIAEVAAETGIAPSELASDGAMLITLVEVIHERNQKRR